MGLQRRPDIVGPDADQWRPSRWETWTPSTSEFIPFNMGPRICLGRNHGLQQIEYVAVRLLQEFEEVVCANERTPGIKVEMNTKPAEPIMCHFKQRNEI
jgi:cytochrome P450